MGYSKINVDSIRRKALESKKAKNIAFTKAEKKVDKEKNNLINSFDSHPITTEISEGPTARNTSGTLGGYGNLFSFIGFDSSENPVKPLRDLLSQIKLVNLKFNRRSGRYEGSVKYPSQQEMKSVTPLPFETGRSWSEGIEKGISGFTQYIYKKFLAGRSKEGFQASSDVRGGNFKKTPYLSALLENFKNKIKGKK